MQAQTQTKTQDQQNSVIDINHSSLNRITVEINKSQELTEISSKDLIKETTKKRAKERFSLTKPNSPLIIVSLIMTFLPLLFAWGGFLGSTIFSSTEHSPLANFIVGGFCFGVLLTPCAMVFLGYAVSVFSDFLIGEKRKDELYEKYVLGSLEIANKPFHHLENMVAIKSKKQEKLLRKQYLKACKKYKLNPKEAAGNVFFVVIEETEKDVEAKIYYAAKKLELQTKTLQTLFSMKQKLKKQSTKKTWLTHFPI